MRRRCWASVVLFFAVPLLAATHAATATILGIDISGNTFSIDQATGASTAVGRSGFIGTNSLARSRSGVIYSEEGNIVIAIDPITGAGTAGPSVFTTNGVRGLAFSPTGVLFAAIATGLAGSVDGIGQISILDPLTGALSLIGSTGFSGIQDIAFSPRGALYGWDTRFGLVTINTATGLATDVNPGLNADAEIQALTFAPDGTLFGARNTLFTIDPRTGASTPVGGSFSDLRGIVIIESTVPEPETISLLGIAALAMTLRRRTHPRRFTRPRQGRRSHSSQVPC